MLSHHILRELEKLLKSFWNPTHRFLSSRTIDLSNVATDYFKEKAKEKLPKIDLNGLLRFTGATNFHRQREKA